MSHTWTSIHVEVTPQTTKHPDDGDELFWLGMTSVIKNWGKLVKTQASFRLDVFLVCRCRIAPLSRTRADLSWKSAGEKCLNKGHPPKTQRQKNIETQTHLQHQERQTCTVKVSLLWNARGASKTEPVAVPPATWLEWNKTCLPSDDISVRLACGDSSEKNHAE